MSLRKPIGVGLTTILRATLKKIHLVTTNGLPLSEYENSLIVSALFEWHILAEEIDDLEGSREVMALLS
jgi:hypothetical protein